MPPQLPHFLPQGMFHNFVNYHNLPIAGRLKHFLPAWERVTKDPWVLQVTQGYLIEFMTEPVQTCTPINTFTTQEDQNLIDQKVRFLWRDSLLEFACLPFGLASAPRVFTKLMKPILSILRQSGICLIAYLDDFLIMGETRQLALQHAGTTLNLLEGLGFVVNYPKSLLVPSQEIEFLGFIVNSLNLSLSLPTDKIKKVRQNCQRLLDKPVVYSPEISKVFGPSVCLNPGSISSTIKLSLPPTCEELSSEKTKILRSPCRSRPKGPSGSALVDGQPSCLEWKGPSPSIY